MTTATMTAPTESELIEARRRFATVVRSKEDTGFEEYPLIFEFPNQVALVVKASKRKFQLFLMFPESGLNPGCELVKVSCPLWKREARGYQVSSAISAATGILERRAARRA